MSEFKVRVRYKDSDGRHQKTEYIRAEDEDSACEIAECLNEVSPSAHDVWSVDLQCTKLSPDANRKREFISIDDDPEVGYYR